MTYAYLHFGTRRVRDAAIPHAYAAPEWKYYGEAERIGQPVNRRRYTPMEPHPSSRRTHAGYYYRMSETDAAAILERKLAGARRTKGDQLREYWV